MAIYIGSTNLTGTTEIHIGSFVPEVYIGSFKTWPEGQIRHVIQNASMQYVNYVTVNNNKYLPASGTQNSYAYCKADVLTYRGNTFVSSASNVTLTATKISGDSAFHINSQNEIYADSRTNVTGATRTATYRFSYLDTTATTATITQQANAAYTKQETLALTAYTEAYAVNGKYPYSGGTYYIPCNRRYSQWTAYTSLYTTTTSETTSTVTAMTYFDTDSYSWLTTGTTEGVGWPRTLVVSENYTNGNAGNRSATIKVGYPISGDWSDYNYVTASTTISQWGRNYNTYAYRISSVNISQDTWPGTQTGTAYTATITATCQYQTTTWSAGTTSSTGNWITYTGRPEMCGNQKPQAGMGNGYYFYLRDPASGTTGYTSDMYYPTTSTTYGTMGVFPYQQNSNTSPRTQDVLITFGTGDTSASTAITLTQQGNVYYMLTPDTLAFPATGATSALTVSASSSGWGVSASTNWLTITTNGNTVYVTAPSNVGPATQARSGNVSIYYNGTVYDTTTVSQVADNYVFTALTTTEVSLAATATSYSNLAIQSTKAGNALAISTSNISITNNTMGLGISGDLVTGGTGIYMVPLSCNTNTSTSTTKSATLTITQPESGKQLVYHFQQGVADNTNIPGVSKLFDLENGWQVGTVTIAWANTDPVKMIVVVRKSATTNTTITMLGDYVLFPPPNHQRTIQQINSGNPKAFSYVSGATFQLTDRSDPDNPQTLTLNGVNTTFSGVNATMNRSTTTPPVEGTCYITIT